VSRGWLLDTNILSEFNKGTRADPGVRAWLETTPEDQLYLSVVTLGEIAKGIALGEARGRDMRVNRDFLEQEIPDRFGERILPFSTEAAIVWGQLMSLLAGNREDEHRLAIDGQIAAIAQTAMLDICSRNTRDFARFGVTSVINPFTGR
jgi:predicted nucleic acid-binding protein